MARSASSRSSSTTIRSTPSASTASAASWCLLTGVFVSAWIFNRGSGFPESAALGQLASGRAAQIGVQALAAVCAAGYSFVMTLILVKIIDMVWGFTLSAKAENEGLDLSQHGEAGFDLGPAVDLVPETATHHAPRPAMQPPNGQQRFTVAVESSAPDQLMHAWSEMCQAGSKPPPEFRAVYPVRDDHPRRPLPLSRRRSDGDVRDNLERLFRDRLNGAAVCAVVEK